VLLNFYPNTEQFVGGMSLPHRPLKIVSAALTEETVGDFLGLSNATGLCCTDDGRLYVWNAQLGQQLLWFLENQSFNTLGLGPENPEELLRYNPDLIVDADQFLTDAFYRQLRVQRDLPTIVFGENGNLLEEKFVQVAANPGIITLRHNSANPVQRGRESASCYLALSESGRIWMSGGVREFALPSEFPENSTALPWFRETSDYTYETPAGLQTAETPLRFTEIRTRPGVLTALTDAGRLFFCGSFLARGGFGILGGRTPMPPPDDDATENLVQYNTVFREFTGFIDSLAVSAGGSGYVAPLANVPLTHSAANYNEPVTLAVALNSGAIQQLFISRPGWGYEGDIAVVFNLNDPFAPGSGAAATATAFTQKWAFLARGTGQLAICENGVLYDISGYQFRTGANPTGFGAGFTNQGFVAAPGRVPHQSNIGYAEVATGLDFGIALLKDGTVETFGVANRTPTLAAQYKLTPLAESGTFVSVHAGTNFAAAVRDDGKVFTYGANAVGQCGRGAERNGLFELGSEPPKPWGQVPGDAVWSDLFVSGCGVIANREGEQLDELGNRLNPLPVWSGIG
jgi:hypothetical protein